MVHSTLQPTGTSSGRKCVTQCWLAYMSWLAQVIRVVAWLQANAQGLQLLPLGAVLDDLVEAAVCHPDAAVPGNCQPMRHQELPTAPAGQHFSSILLAYTSH